MEEIAEESVPVLY